MDDDSIWGMGKCSKSLNLKPRLGDLRRKSRECIMKLDKYLVGLSFSVSGRFAPKVYLGNWPSVLLQLRKTWTTTVYKLTLQALQALLLHQGAWKEMHYQALLTSSSSAAALDGIGLALSSVSRTSGRFSARLVEFWNLHGEPGPCSALYFRKPPTSPDIPTFTVPPSLPFLHPSWRCLYLTSFQSLSWRVDTESLWKSWMFNQFKRTKCPVERLNTWKPLETIEASQTLCGSLLRLRGSNAAAREIACIIAAFLAYTCVDDVDHVVDGHRCLCDVGGEHHLQESSVHVLMGWNTYVF